ncbi:MAG: Trk system potassium transporter TrkA [Gammaproteobacteria bacterium]|nr:Trk system potassium transporter TrkA [Gammaproteobacteria bacterium]
MKILILGAGQTGGTLAENLASEDFDITLVDEDAGRLKELKDRLDIQTVHGHASRPDTLLAAGADDVDLLIAVTNSDEVNMVACQVCYSLFKTPRKIARIRSNEYITGPNGDDAEPSAGVRPRREAAGGGIAPRKEGFEFFSREHMPIDVLINPERAVMEQIKELLQYPGALQVLDFADGRVKLVAVRTYHGGPLVGQELRSLREHIPNVDTKVVAIFRQGRPIIPTADTVVEVDDDVFFIAAADDINAVMAEMRHLEGRFKRVIIAGGGNIGLLLARAIENQFHVKVIEFAESRAQVVAERLSSGVAILGDATNRDLLIEENIEDTDAFCAVTNNDEVNIMSALLAKRLGVRQVLSLITKPAYVDVVQGSDIDIAVSPQLATTSSILSHVRRGDVARVHRLRRGAAEALEAVVHGDARTSRVVDRSVGQISLPAGVTIGAIVRGDEPIIAADDVVIKNGDHVVLFMIDKGRIRAVERLFQVGLSFF